MDVILTAGGIPGSDDPLYPLTQGQPKALLPIHGKAMIQWTLDALAEAKSIGQLVLVGLADEVDVQYPRPLTRISNQGDMVSNITAASQVLRDSGKASQHALVVASDVPGVTPQILDWMTAQVEALDKDLVYTVVTKEVMETRYPHAKRSYIPLKDVSVCGGDVNAICLEAINYDNPMWRKLVDRRKNAVAQAALLGLDTLLLIVLRALTLQQTEKRVCKRLGLDGALLVSPYAEIAMDIDKPGQLDLVARDLEKQHK